MEEWKVVDGTDGTYEVSSYGTIRHAETKRIRKLQRKHGYCRINMKINGKDKNCAVHRLVAQAFIPNPDNKPQVNHKDGVHDNNHVDNLEWVTASENLKHAADNHLHERGMEYARTHGKGRYDKKDRAKAYLKKSEYITKAGYDKLICVAEKYDITVGKLCYLFDRVMNNDDIKIDTETLVARPSDEYKDRLTRPLIDRNKKLRSEIENLQRKLKEEIREEAKYNYRHCAGTTMENWAIGNKNNYLTIVGYSRNPCGKQLVCQCDCGNVILVGGTHWERGKVKSCGCKHDDLASQQRDETKQDWLHKLWLRRHREDTWYPEWRDYHAFYEWAYDNGYAQGKFLYRIDPRLNFSPENCIWKNKEAKCQQVRKPPKQYNVDGNPMTIDEAAELCGCTREALYYHVHRKGETLEEAVHYILDKNNNRNSLTTQ